MDFLWRTVRVLPAILIAAYLAGCAAGTASRVDPPPLPPADNALARAEFREAMSLARDGRIAAAGPHYRLAAENGHVEAQFVLATMYRTGRGMPQDMDQAVLWYSRSAKAGYAMAQFTLGNLYMKGDGVGQSLKLATELFEQAAEQDHPEAQYNLGVYHYGAGTEDGYRSAEQWFLRAARQGEPSSQYALGRLYATPHDGVRLDRVRAYAWYSLAASNGHEKAKTAVARLDAGLSAAERTSARSLARRLAAAPDQ